MSAIAAATAVAWFGALAAVVTRRAGTRVMRPLVYLSLLFFGASAIFDVFPVSKAALSWPIFLSAAAAGVALPWLAGRYVAPVCPACAMRSLETDHHHAHGGGLALLAAVLAVHCFLDGVGVSVASDVSASLATRVFAAIAVHKFPEGFALALLAMGGGRRPWRSFAFAAGVELATVAGGFASAFRIQPSEFWLSIVLANVGGTFLYLAAAGLRDALSPGPLATGHSSRGAAHRA